MKKIINAVMISLVFVLVSYTMEHNDNNPILQRIRAERERNQRLNQETYNVQGATNAYQQLNNVFQIQQSPQYFDGHTNSIGDLQSRRIDAFLDVSQHPDVASQRGQDFATLLPIVYNRCVAQQQAPSDDSHQFDIANYDHSRYYSRENDSNQDERALVPFVNQSEEAGPEAMDIDQVEQGTIRNTFRLNEWIPFDYSEVQRATTRDDQFSGAFEGNRQTRILETIRTRTYYRYRINPNNPANFLRETRVRTTTTTQGAVGLWGRRNNDPSSSDEESEENDEVL